MSALSATAEDVEGSAAAGDVRDHEIDLGVGFALESGESLDDPCLRIRLQGPEDAPVVIAAGGISATRKVADVGGEEGWWRDVARAHGAIDTTRWRLASFDFLPGAEAGAKTITPGDQARALRAALARLGICSVHAFVGASYGGVVGLAFAAQFPDSTARLCVISAAARAHPMSTALRGVQRRIIALAVAAGRPEEGVALARELAMTTYRTTEEFAARFSSEPLGPRAGDPYDVCGYLQARGRAYALRTPPARYIALSDSLDRARIDTGRIRAECLFVAATKDRLVPAADTRAVAHELSGRSSFLQIDSAFGHDAFLCDAALFERELKAFLEKPR